MIGEYLLKHSTPGTYGKIRGIMEWLQEFFKKIVYDNDSWR
jgi:hypothetical protein